MGSGNGDVAGGLAETIEALRAELTAAMVRGSGKPLQFELGQVDVELTLAISREGSGDGGLRFGVVSFGAAGKAASETTHRLSLTLSPVTARGDGPVRVTADVDGEPR
ncbi:trypco2 family protein [Streptosporangium sp. NPDC087985]|uniref:trypco2 family protein n=1 Tax=Streptosporangium sp. NPDC087985 TaxID=3366196 RepID=UPI003829F636